MLLSHLQGLLDAAALRATARAPGAAHAFSVTVFPGNGDLLSALAAEGSRRIQATGSGPWQTEALRALRTRLGQPRPARAREDVGRGLQAWFAGQPGGAPPPDPVAEAFVEAVMRDLDALLGPGWHGERSPLQPEAPYAEATLLLGSESRLLLELSLDD